MNTALKRTGGEFAKRFTRERLRAGGVRIRRKGIVKKPGKSAPSLPKKMRLAGFKGEVTGLRELEKKMMRIRTRSPVMYAHEFGATITPKRARAMRVEFSRQPRGLSKEDRDKAFLLKSRQGDALIVVPTKTPTGRKKLRPIAHLQRRVVVPKRLGFMASWRSYRPRAVERINDAMAGFVLRIAARGR